MEWKPRARQSSLASELIAELEPFTIDPVFAAPQQTEEKPPEVYEALELDLINVLETIVDPNTKMIRDLKIDDRDFPEFPNINEFFMAKNGLNIKPFTRQLWMLVTLFHEFCPDCTRKKKWMHSVLNCPIDLPAEEFGSYVQLLNHGKCPKCGKTKLDFFKDKSLAPYQELAALLGQRTGKSTMLMAPSAVYMMHKYLKIPRPWELYGLNPTTLFGTVVAQTYAAASDQLWLPIKTYIDGCSWFTDMHGMLTDIGLRKGEELFTFTTTQVHYKHRALMIYPSGPNRKTLRGKTRFFACTDEFDFFDGNEDSDAIKMNGKEVRTSLNNSLANVRIEWRNVVKKGLVNAPGGVSIYASSPDHAMGVLTQLVKQKRNSRSILALNLATWEIHPKLTRKAIIRAFDPDPMRLERDFGAQPPLNANPFIENPDTVEALSDEKRPNRVKIRVETVMNRDALQLVPHIEKLLEPPKMRANVLALDAGYSNNSFAMAVLGPPVSDQSEIKCVCHALLEVMPRKGGGRINFHSVYENLIVPIVRQLNVRAILADRWNSLKLLHDAEADLGIYSEQYSLKYTDFVYVQSYLESGTVSIPRFDMKPEERLNPDLTQYPHCFEGHPVDHFFFQAVTVRDLGKTVDKGIGLTDDLFRAFVLGTRFVLDEEFAKTHLRGTMERRAAGGIAAGTSYGNVSGYGNTLQGKNSQRTLSLQDAQSSGVAAASGGTGGGVVSTPGVFARTPR